MSKYQKALDPDTNAIYDWEIVSITKSAKVGKLVAGQQSMRSRIFWIKLPTGKEYLPLNQIVKLFICRRVKKLSN